MPLTSEGEHLLLPELRVQVWQANMALQTHKLVTFTWGNVSAIDRNTNLIVIKPSGVAYEDLSPENMVIVDLDGNIVEGDLKPSSDTETHLALYRRFEDMGGIVHTHSSYATSWAQAGLPVPAFGTTHADYFYGQIPCARALTSAEIEQQYELNTGKVIIETIGKSDPMAIPGILVREHAPFTWGKNAHDAVHNAVVVEEVAKMAFRTININPNTLAIPQALLDKHYLRKHGKNAYYGQK